MRLAVSDLYQEGRQFYRCDAPASYAPSGEREGWHYSRQLLPYRQFEAAARVYLHKPALITSDTTLSFAQLDRMIDALASGLIAMDLRRGEGIAVLLGNRWEQLPLFLAAAKIGAVFMAASRYLTPSEIDYQLGAFRPRLVIGAGGYRLEEILKNATDRPVPVFDDENAGFALRFSSGTTGKPKMMIGAQRASASLYASVAAEQGLTCRDRHLVVGPLAHMALHMALAQLMVGGTVVLKEAFEKERLWADCEQHGITNVAVVPTMIAAALDYPGDAPDLRVMVSMGASLAPALKRKLLGRFPKLGLFEMYGASELGMVTSLRPEDQLRKPASAGRPSFGQDVAIFDDDGKAVPPGSVGTIYVRGPLGILRYLGEVRPAPPPAHLAQDGWIHCGDLGYLDEEGFLFISDRRVDLILSGGLNVYPAEVEAVLCEIDGIAAAAVVGAPDERWGQRVTAYVEGAGSEEIILAVCREKLAAYKLPRAIFFVEQLPRTSSGKSSRHLVRQAIERGALPS